MITARGQSMVEYLLALVVIFLVLLYAMRNGGPVQQAVGNVVGGSTQQMRNAVSAATTRIRL